MRRKNQSNIVMRAFELVRALNASNRATVTELSANAGMSRQAVYRILEVLSAEGYVTRDDRGRFQLTHLVRALSDGFKDEDWVAEIASPILEELQRKITWPTDLGLYANYALQLRKTTRPSSPLVIDQGLTGFRLPMLATSMGLAYIAFCPDEEREDILYGLRKSEEPLDQIARDIECTRALIESTRTDGYGSRFRAIFHETGSIGVPIRFQGRVHACIGMTFFASVFNPKEAAARYLHELTGAASRIEESLRRVASRNAGAPTQIPASLAHAFL